MSYPSKPILSIGERLQLLFKVLLFFPIRATFNVNSMVLIALWRRLPIAPSIISAMVKTVFVNFNGREIQNLVPTSRQAYTQWIEAKSKKTTDPKYKSRLIRDVQPLPSGRDSAILWLGDRSKAKKVVLFFHGGGYVIPLSPGHCEWNWNTYVVSGIETGAETAVAILQYSCAPDAQYPVQLGQAISAFNEIQALGFAPADIIVGGDSAGGNLTLAFLSHVLHPHPEFEAINLSAPLSATFFVSPWVSRNYASRSSKANSARDMISIAAAHKITRAYLAPSDVSKCDAGGNYWAMGADADSTWYSGMDKIVKKAYITYGTDESLADQGRRLAELISKQNPGIDLLVQEGEKELHDAIIIESTREIIGPATTRMENWYKSVL